MKKQNQISEKSYKASGFIGRYQKLVTGTVIPWQEKILWDKPLRELTQATGHTVRAVYLYAGMADYASETEDKELQGACGRLWKNIVERKTTHEATAVRLRCVYG